ncbi:MAG: MarC family NAAT transporter [Microvirgula sp.]
MSITQLVSQYLLGALLSLVVITNPLSKIPMFISLTTHDSRSQRARVALDACLYAGGIMVVSLIGGNVVLEMFGISYGALRVAGGIVVALVGYRMLYHSQDTTSQATREGHQVAFFPLAMPGISGPGTIAVVIGFSTEIAEISNWHFKLAALGLTLVAIVGATLCVWLALRLSSRISEQLGPSAMDVLTRLMGFLLICVGVQFIGSGVRTFYTSL